MNTAIIGIGSNIDAERNVSIAKRMLGEKLSVLGESKFVRTKPVGPQEQQDFLNGSLLIKTRLGLKGLKALLKGVEIALGRNVGEDRYGPRKMDLDILAWNGEIVDSDVYEREFLCRSVIELCPELEKTLKEPAPPEETEILEGLVLRKVLSKKEIKSAIWNLAKKISEDYEGKTPVLVCVLLGARPFFEDLAERMTISSEKQFLRVSSYREATRPGHLELVRDIECGIEGRDVIIIEDIIDTSETAKFILRHMESKNPGSLRICALIDKRGKETTGSEPDYSGFRVDEGFLVGYGMDYMGRARALEDIYLLQDVV